jgi:spore maturation protein CgeB
VKLGIVKFAYQKYLRQWYATRPDEGRRTYAEQQAALEHDAFWWGWSWSRVLPAHGVEVSEFAMNAEPLQRAWAREHGVALGPVGWMAEVLRRQVADARPDALLIQSFKALSPELLAAIRAENPGLRAIIGWVGSPHVRPELLDACDHVLSCVPEVVRSLREAGRSCSHMNHAFDPAVLERVDRPAQRDIAFSFAGAVGNPDEHLPRAKLIFDVAARTPLEVFADVPRTRLRHVGGLVAAKGVYAVGAGLRRAGVPRTTLLTIPLVRQTAAWPSPPVYRRAPAPRRRLHAPVFGLRMFDALRRSQVTLNAHSTISPLSTSNLRTFEATGIGTCLLTDWRPNVGELFEPDLEVVTYRSVAECVERATWLLDHPAEAERIAVAGQRRALAEHTFAHRAPVLADAVRGALAS